MMVEDDIATEGMGCFPAVFILSPPRPFFGLWFSLLERDRGATETKKKKETLVEFMAQREWTGKPRFLISGPGWLLAVGEETETRGADFLPRKGSLTPGASQMLL